MIINVQLYLALMETTTVPAQFIVLVLSVLLYFLPSIVGRQKRNANAILAFNLFLGWTVIGWIAALVWSLMTEPASHAT